MKFKLQSFEDLNNTTVTIETEDVVTIVQALEIVRAFLLASGFQQATVDEYLGEE